MNYTIQLWAQLVSDFAKEFVDQPYVLVGNSIGSLVSLQAAKLRRNAGDPPQPCGIVLINCAGATLRSWVSCGGADDTLHVCKQVLHGVEHGSCTCNIRQIIASSSCSKVNIVQNRACLHVMASMFLQVA